MHVVQNTCQFVTTTIMGKAKRKSHPAPHVLTEQQGMDGCTYLQMPRNYDNCVSMKFNGIINNFSLQDNWLPRLWTIWQC